MTKELYLDTVGEIACELYVNNYGTLNIADAFELAEKFMKTAVERDHASPL